MSEITCHDDVINAIQQFCKDYRYSCSFGHIVLDDYNLGDSSIKYCLRQDVINDWFERNLKDCDPATSNPESSNSWERYQYDELTELRDEIVAFLRFLLTVPEDVRDDWEEE